MEEEKVFIQNAMNKKNVYYNNVFELVSSGKSLSWNWSAALFSTFWLIYHKMYKEFFLYLALIEFFSYFTLRLVHNSIYNFTRNTCSPLDKYIVENPSILKITGLGIILSISLIFGLFGNKIFLCSLKRKYKNGYNLVPTYKFKDSLSLWLLFLLPLFLSITLAVLLNFTNMLNEVPILVLCVFFLFTYIFLSYARPIYISLSDFLKAKKALSENGYSNRPNLF